MELGGQEEREVEKGRGAMEPPWGGPAEEGAGESGAKSRTF